MDSGGNFILKMENFREISGLQGQERGGAAREEGGEGWLQGHRPHRGHAQTWTQRVGHQEQVFDLIMISSVHDSKCQRDVCYSDSLSLRI